MVPFPTSFIGREDRGLDARLQAGPELRGILRRGTEALPALMRRGRLPEPASVANAAAFVSASDAVRAWIGEACVLDPDAWTARSDLYAAYSQHTMFDGSRRLGANEFYNRIEQIHGINPAIRRGVRGFKGIRGADRGAGVQLFLGKSLLPIPRAQGKG